MCLHSAVWYYSQNLPPVSLTPAANLPLVSLTPVAICSRYQRHQRYLWQNLPLVFLITVVHLHLQISPRVFGKIRNDPNVIFGGLGEDDSWKKPEAKTSNSPSLVPTGAPDMVPASSLAESNSVPLCLLTKARRSQFQRQQKSVELFTILSPWGIM